MTLLNVLNIAGYTYNSASTVKKLSSLILLGMTVK